jgi:hypothetical protein
MDTAIGLPANDVDNIEVLIRADEWLEAFETLCIQIDEQDISLTEDVIRDLEDLGSVLGAKRDFTDYLRGSQEC